MAGAHCHTHSHLLTSSTPTHVHYRGRRRSSVSANPLSPHSLLKANVALLALCSTIAAALPHYIPGLKTSATFLSSLRQNLCLVESDDEYSQVSDVDTTQYRPISSTLTVRTPGLAIMASEGHPQSALLTPDSEPDTNPLEGVPDLSTFVAESEADRREALKLVADSIAQQRQVAGRYLLSHPINVTAFTVLIAVVGQLLYNGPHDKAKVFSTFIGLTMTYLVLIRWIVDPYVSLAEKLVTWNWLGDDTILATKYGDKIIGALVLGWNPSSSGKGRAKYKKGGKGVVRAWTVLLKYRGKGEGRALMEDAIALTQKRGGEGLRFEEDGIYSQRVMPRLYNTVFDQRDRRAQLSLDKAVNEKAAFGKRR